MTDFHIVGVETEDHALVYEGDRVFDYYGMKWGTIRVGSIDSSGWFYVDHEDGTKSLLNGERIATYDPRERNPNWPRQDRCVDCGMLGERTGHMECQYPQDH